MLSPEVMGALALAVLWVNTLLIAADALKRHAALGQKARALEEARARGRLLRARVLSGLGPGGALATTEVEQTGRAMTVAGPQRIAFTDRALRGVIHGGEIEIDGARRTLEAAEGAEVWTDGVLPRGDREAFDSAWPAASTFKGLRTTGVRALVGGDEVWIELDGGQGARLVASEDPALVVGRAQRPLRWLVLAALGGGALVTTLALWPPVFGTLSTIGGAAALVFFLAIQPLGTAARDRASLPDRRVVGGTWQRPA